MKYAEQHGENPMEAGNKYDEAGMLARKNGGISSDTPGDGMVFRGNDS